MLMTEPERSTKVIIITIMMMIYTNNLFINIFQANCYAQGKSSNFKISNFQKFDLQKFNALEK